MRYACLVYVDPRAFDGSPRSNAVLAEAAAHRAELDKSQIPNEVLATPAEAVTVRFSNGRLSRTDGPFMETKEALAGFVIIEAADMDAAIKIASANPMAKIGAVEVRQLVDFGRPRPVL